MIMITGGAFQGKRRFAVSELGISERDIFDCSVRDISELSAERCAVHYELAVKQLMARGIDPLGFTEKLSCDIVIMNEIGCGIIPLDKGEREWREMTGRAGCIIAERAETVYRVCCGIATVIKGGSD